MAGTAQVSVLHEGYAREEDGADRVGSTVTLIHDHWASYDGDRWISREPGDFALTPSVRLVATPGHTAEDITTLAATPDGVYACTHAWWGPDGPAEDPLGTDQAALHQSRARILEAATVIIPGHAPAFRPAPATPR